MSVPVVYISCTLRPGGEALAEELAAIAIAAGWRAYLPHVETAKPGDSTPAATVRDRNLAAIGRADCVLVESSMPSTGVGFELAFAWELGKPILLIHQRGERQSRMIQNLGRGVINLECSTPSERKAALVAALQTLAGDLIVAQTRNRLVTVEGLDGVGKTSFVEGLREKIELMGATVITVTDPPASPPWQEWRAKLQESGEKIDRLAEALLLLAMRTDSTRRLILPALRQETIVIADRYYLSWFAYQSHRLETSLPDSGYRDWLLTRFNSLAASAGCVLEPRVTFYLEASPSVRRDRLHSRPGAPSKYEDPTTQESVGAFYERYLNIGAGRVVRFDTSGAPLSELVGRAMGVLAELGVLPAPRSIA